MRAISDPRTAEVAANALICRHLGSNIPRFWIQVNPEEPDDSASVESAAWSRCTARKASRSAGRRTWEEEGLYNADPDPSRESFAIAHPPPNVTGDLHLGHALQLSLADTIVRTRRMQGFNVLFQPGYDHAGHLDAERGREAPRGEGQVAPGLRARGVRRARLGVAPRVRRQDHVPVPPDRRLARLPPRALHDGRRVRPGGDALLRPPLGEGLDLPREPDRQLVPVPPDLALRPRARARGRRRRAHLRPLPAGRGRGHITIATARRGDDPRRRRGRRPPRRRALPGRWSAARWSCRGSSAACR